MTDKQKRFVEEYLIDLNATQAAIRAGYKPDHARSVGSENLTKPDIQEAIIKANAERSQRTKISADSVLNELSNIAFCCDVKTPDKLKALELLGKHLGLFRDKLDISGSFKTEMTNLESILQQLKSNG